MLAFPTAVLFITHLLLVRGDCPSGTTKGVNGLCYKAYTTESTWNQSEATCMKNNGHLASITDAYTNAFLFNYTSGNNQMSNYWIGGTTNIIGGNWSWSDGQKFSYSYWASG